MNIAAAAFIARDYVTTHLIVIDRFFSSPDISLTGDGADGSRA